MKKYKFEIDRLGDKYWYWKGEKHRRNDLPAVIYFNGTEEYWENGERVDKCRENG